MLKYFFFCLFILSFGLQKIFAQLKEDFSDGNITQNPEWTGQMHLFQVNSKFQLQGNSTKPNDHFYITTPNTLAEDVEWEFWIHLDFNTSSVNYVDVYLISQQANLLNTNNAGYFVRIGGTTDEISLFRLDNGDKITKIIDGRDGITGTSGKVFKVKVTRDKSHQWHLFLDASGTGSNFTREGTVHDSLYTASSWFGFLVKQSTASFFQKQFFDDIVIKKYEPDIAPPVVDSVIATTATSLTVFFNEPVSSKSLQTFNFSVNNGMGMPQTVTESSSGPASLQLTFANTFENRRQYELLVKDIEDEWGNILKDQQTPFTYNIPLRYDVLITEIFADPSPAVGLPPHKFIEIFNRSPYPVAIGGWRLQVGDQFAVLPNYTMPPETYLILASSGSASAYHDFGIVLTVPGFPNLPVAKGEIALYNSRGYTMHAVEYNEAMFKNEVKKEGGWSLEMIDVSRGCESFENWSASVSGTGGTPGSENSVKNDAQIEQHLSLLHAYYDKELVLVFDKSVDSAAAARTENFTAGNGAVLKVIAEAPLFKRIRIDLENEPDDMEMHEIKVRNLFTCNGAPVSELVRSFGRLSQPDSFDIVINEILFHPAPGSVDYVELYNRSKHIINAQQLYLANRNSRGEIAGLSRVSEAVLPFYPNEYLLLSENQELVLNNYQTVNKHAFVDMTAFPSYANTSGNVVLLNTAGMVLDEVVYDEKWHHSQIKNAAGVALERIDSDGASTYQNFHSAAASLGYGTPGYRNSQHRVTEEFKGEIKIAPAVFTPDGDGNDDFALIHYSFPDIGFVANIKIFDAAGKQVRHLEKNSISAMKGFFKWDGTNDTGQPLPQGVYVLYTYIYNRLGKMMKFKDIVVLGRKGK